MHQLHAPLRISADPVSENVPAAHGRLSRPRHASKRAERTLGPLDLEGYRSTRRIRPSERVAKAASAVPAATGF
jgi:hypothetical protein